MSRAATSNPIRAGWAVSPGLVEYPSAVAFMKQRVEDIASGAAPELVWLLEHPACYTAGTSAKPSDLVFPHQFPVHESRRGGELTYHGPGQRVVYVMLNIARRSGDVRLFVRSLEGWLVAALARLGVDAGTRPGRVGVWVPRPNGDSRDDKIAAIGLRVRRGVSSHGVSLNVAPDLAHYAGIVPCGVRDHGVTSLAALGIETSMSGVDAALRATFEETFGPARSVPGPGLALRVQAVTDRP